MSNIINAIASEMEQVKTKIRSMVDEYNRVDQQRMQLRQEVSKLEGQIVGYNNALTILHTQGSSLKMQDDVAENYEDNQNIQLA